MGKPSYNLVVIKHTEENKFFVGKVPSFLKQKGLSLLYNFIEYENDQGIVYKKLSEYVKEKGKNCYVVSRSSDNKTKDEAEKIVYDYQQKVIAKFGEEALLNDQVISPEKYQCECGHMVRLFYKDAHDEKYCASKKIISILEELM